MLKSSQMPLLAAVLLSTAVGCTTMQNMGSSMKSLVSKRSDPQDPLSDVTGKPSSTYKTAKRELKAADETLLKFAQWREDLGDHSESLDRYREILRDNPDSIDARLGIARIEYKTGRVHEAEEILKATARQHPENLAVWIEMGRIQTEREQYVTAIESLNQAVKIDPDNQSARFRLGLALAKVDRFQEAQPHLAFAVGESAAMFNIGYVLQEAGRSAESAVWLQKALQSHPDERTQRSASQMLAQLQSGTTNNIAARTPQPPKVDEAATRYTAYTEVPGQPTITPGASSATVAAHRPSTGSELHVQPASHSTSTSSATPAGFASFSPAAPATRSGFGTAQSAAANASAPTLHAMPGAGNPAGHVAAAAAQPASTPSVHNGYPAAGVSNNSASTVQNSVRFAAMPAITPGKTEHSQNWQQPTAAPQVNPYSGGGGAAQPANTPPAAMPAPATSGMVEPAPWRGGI